MRKASTESDMLAPILYPDVFTWMDVEDVARRERQYQHESY